MWAFNNEDEDEDGWVELPGPADWWPEGEEDLNATGFFFHPPASGYKEAYEMIYAEKEPEDGSYNRIFPSANNLYIMEETELTRTLLRAFTSLISH